MIVLNSDIPDVWIFCHSIHLSKNLNKKSDDKKDKEEQKALKESEIVAELAPNEETRKEAEKLIETVDYGCTSVQEQEQEAIETVLDETKLREKFQSIRKLWVRYKRKQSKQQSKSDMI